MLGQLGKIGRRQHLHRYYKERK